MSGASPLRHHCRGPNPGFGPLHAPIIEIPRDNRNLYDFAQEFDYEASSFRGFYVSQTESYTVSLQCNFQIQFNFQIQHLSIQQSEKNHVVNVNLLLVGTTKRFVCIQLVISNYLH